MSPTLPGDALNAERDGVLVVVADWVPALVSYTCVVADDGVAAGVQVFLDGRYGSRGPPLHSVTSLYVAAKMSGLIG